MVYTDLTRKAMLIAYKAHAGDLDHSGVPYILHPVHLAEQMTTEDTCVVALLHDVMEDTFVTEETLRKAGFTEPQLTALKLMTHRDGVPYMEYVEALKDDPIARTVKLADLDHNMDRTRLTEFTEADERRYQKYQKAKALLLEAEAEDKRDQE